MTWRAEQLEPVERPDSPAQRLVSVISFSVVINTQSGTLRGVELDAFEDRLARALSAPRFRIVSMQRTDRPITDVLDAVATEDSNGILVVGGDGSVSASAALAWRTGRVLAVVPGGTMNLYARTLGMPLELDEALAALALAEERQVDIATANGRAFVPPFTVGLHANAVQLRQRMDYSSRLGKLLATARAFGSVILRPGNFKVRVRVDSDSIAKNPDMFSVRVDSDSIAKNPDRFSVRVDSDSIAKNPDRVRRLSALSVSCNRFGTGHVPYADRPDGGVLGVYCSKPVGYLAALRLVMDITLGTTASNDDVDSAQATRAQLDFPTRWRRRRAMLDGELIDLEPTAEIILHAGALRVLQPCLVADD